MTKEKVLEQFKTGVGAEVLGHLDSHVDVNASTTRVVGMRDTRNLGMLELGPGDALVNLVEINRVDDINLFLRSVRSRLAEGAVYVGSVRTPLHRRNRIKERWPGAVASMFLAAHFTVFRLLPRLPGFRRVLRRFHIAEGLSLTEVLGRLVYSGFDVEEYGHLEGVAFFVARAAREPSLEKVGSEGVIFTMRRVGKDGKPIRVVKLRTMHPYSEYLQDLVFKRHSLAPGGKFKDDFRIPRWGTLMRRLWLDEIPMIWNWVRGDLKLVGVRPISEHYLDLYPENVRCARCGHRPGLIPPFYADLPSSFEEIVASEARYMESYESSPLRTDIRYFFKALRNIIGNRARSG